MLYNYPGRMCVSMDEEYFTRVSQSKKTSSPSRKVPATWARCIGWPGSSPTSPCPADGTTRPSNFFAWGARSWVCAGSNFLPKEHVALYEACVIEKNFDKGRQIMSAMMPLMNALDGGKFVQSIKYGCEVAGLKVGNVRLPLQPLEADEKAEFRIGHY